DRYLHGIPADSRAANPNARFLNRDDITEDKLAKVRQLNELAQNRGQTLAQLALTWVLRRKTVASVLIGASKVSQIEDNAGIVNKLTLTDDEIGRIEEILRG